MAFNLEDYETVEERLEKFHKDFPDFRIETQLVAHSLSRFIVQAWIYRTFADAVPFSSGLAFEDISERGVNATSALENCETSALGRALANAGYATKGKRASRSEMSKVQNKFEKRIADKVPVENPVDPWTIQQKDMPLPVADAVTALNDGIKPEEIPTCPTHNKPCLPHSGNTRGKEWRNYKCPESWPNKCNYIVWLEVDKTGRWVPQRPRPTQGAIN